MEQICFRSGGRGQPFLDSLTSDDLLGGFESLSLSIEGDGVSNGYFLDSIAAFASLFSRDILLSVSASDPVSFDISYSFTTRSPGQGFGFDYSLVGGMTPPPAAIPVPAALPLLASALAALGLLLGWRRRLAA